MKMLQFWEIRIDRMILGSMNFLNEEIVTFITKKDGEIRKRKDLNVQSNRCTVAGASLSRYLFSYNFIYKIWQMNKEKED